MVEIGSETKVVVQTSDQDLYEHDQEMDAEEQERIEELRAQIRHEMNVWDELQRFCEKQWELLPKEAKFIDKNDKS